MPLRVLYRRLLRLEEVPLSPMTDVELPAVRGKRLQIATPEEAVALIAAVPAAEQAIWATAMYGGLRIGEIQALDVVDVDLANGVIHVEWNWDRVDGKVEPKSEAGKRIVPVPGVLRDHLLDHRMRFARETGLLFGRTATDAFRQKTVIDHATAAWDVANMTELEAVADALGVNVNEDTTLVDLEAVIAAARKAGGQAREPKLLRRLTPHDCRHTYASLMIAAMAESPEGFNPKLLSTYMGHSTIAITIDRYGHLFPGSEKKSAGALDAFLERSDTAARKEAVSDG